MSLWNRLQREIKYRYYFREIRNPKKYAKRNRNKKEPMWDFILWFFRIKPTMAKW